MAGHLLRDFELTAILQIRRDASRPKAVAGDFRLDAGRLRPPSDHRADVLPRERSKVDAHVQRQKLYELVESIQTPNGPRQRMICSLGSLEPAPPQDWLGLAHKLQSALQGQESLPESSTEVQPWVEKARQRNKTATASHEDRSGSMITLDIDKVEMEQAREAGPVHVGHQLWRQLGMNPILQGAGLSARACMLTEVMTLNRLISPSSDLKHPKTTVRVA